MKISTEKIESLLLYFKNIVDEGEKKIILIQENIQPAKENYQALNRTIDILKLDSQGTIAPKPSSCHSERSEESQFNKPSKPRTPKSDYKKNAQKLIFAICKVLHQSDMPMRGRDIHRELNKLHFHFQSKRPDSLVAVTLCSKKNYFTKTDQGYELLPAGKALLGVSEE